MTTPKTMIANVTHNTAFARRRALVTFICLSPAFSSVAASSDSSTPRPPQSGTQTTLPLLHCR